MRTLLIHLLVLVALARSCAGADDGMAADFAWFSTLGFPEVRDLPFVRYGSGAQVTIEGKSQELWSSGFLLGETPDAARVLTLDLNTEEIAKTGQVSGPPPRVKPDDLRTIAEDILAHPPGHQEEGYAHYHRSLAFNSAYLTSRAQLFVLAWMCDRKGLPDPAERLYAAAQTARDIFNRENPGEKGWPFRDKLAHDLGEYEIERTFIDFGNVKVTRRELFGRLQTLLGRHWPCEHLADLKKIADQLGRMIAEDDAHSPRSPEEIAKLPPAEQASEWIYRLRDQDGGRPAKSDGVWMADIFESGADSPAHRLVKLGDAAVPGLIAALDDTRLTRSASYAEAYPADHVVTIGEAALQILERIAGRPFDRSGLLERSRPAIEQWWTARQKKGVSGELAETAAKGVYESMSAADRLFTDYPAEAATPILAGAAAAQDDGMRSYFVRLAGKLRDDRVPDFLLHEAREGPLPGARVEAAWQLSTRGRTEGIPLLIGEWRRFPSSPKPREQYTGYRLIAYLAMTDSADTLRALAAGLHQRSADVRSYVIHALTPSDLRLGEFPELRPIPAASTRSAAIQSIIEELAVNEASDTGAYFTLARRNFDRNTYDPFLCDDAAALLAAAWPDRYHFDVHASYPVRERARIACLNVWREAHQQPPLPLPPERPPVAPGDELKIAEVAFPGEDPKLLDPLSAILSSAKGKMIDSDFLRSIERGFLEAVGQHALDADRGYYVEAFREKATDGVTLFAGPLSHGERAPQPTGQWKVNLSTSLSDARGASNEGLYLQGQDPLETNPEGVAKMMAKIAAVPNGKSFSVRMEIIPAN